MDELRNITKLKFTYNVYAVMFGTDDTLLKIKLHDGFSFIKKSLVPKTGNLDKIFGIDGLELRREYGNAIIDNNSLDVICAMKQLTFELSTSQAHDYFYEMAERDSATLYTQIQSIRLFNEFSLRYNKISFSFSSNKNIQDGTDCGYKFNIISTVYESIGTKTILQFHCNDCNSVKINNELLSSPLPISDQMLNTCHIHYDLSYHQDNHISITLLITALEMLYLENEDAKKQKLAKRCSAYLYKEQNDRLNCYQMLICLYKKRCDFVHEGVFDCIDDKDIIFLRRCVRMSLLRILNDNLNKKERILKLTNIISNSDYYKDKKNK